MSGRGADDGYSEVLAQLDTETAANAMAVAQAVYAGVGLADRFRDALGVAVTLETSDSHRESAIAGTVADVAIDAVALRDRGSGSHWIVPMDAIEAVRGLPPGHRGPSGVADGRRSLRTLLRPWSGCDATVALRRGPLHGRLQRVGTDHLQLQAGQGSVVVPLAAICWVRVLNRFKSGSS